MGIVILALSCIPGMRVSSDAAPAMMVLGDSLSSGFGIRVEQGWVSLLEQRFMQRGLPHRVVNASISGDTTRGGAARLPSALRVHRPDIVLVELGGNDGLRGVPLDETRSNLESILRMVAASGAQALLAGMRLPPNYGPRYTESFHAMYGELARQFGVPLIPFLLEGVAEDPTLMQADGIHPTAEAQAAILENVWPHLTPLLSPGRESGPAAMKASVPVGLS